MAKDDHFKWQIGSDPPVARGHSIAKLRLLRRYLDRYFDTLAQNPRTERLQISLVDGFCGGGQFSSSDGIISGTPLIMLEAVEGAIRRINEDRQKKYEISATYYFVDKSPLAIKYLRWLLEERGYNSQIDQNIKLIGKPFEDVFADIVDDIGTRGPSGRSLFLLDQFGWGQVAFATTRYIMSNLRASEVILTFAVDWLLQYLSENVSNLKALAPIELDEIAVRRLVSARDLHRGRYLIQRVLIGEITHKIGADFFTPFFIRSTEANRDIWLIHLSKHHTARNVMTATHWDVQNTSLHQGTAGLNMLGFHPEWQDTLPLDFAFDGNAEAQTALSLYQDLPRAIGEKDLGEPISIDALHRAIANGTTARVDHINAALERLYTDREIEILTPTGQLKRPDARLHPFDRVTIPRQLFLPGIMPNRS